MFQQLLALIIIIFFLSRLFWQKRKKNITTTEFSFWLVFWFIASLSIIFIKKIDQITANLGFSGSGIDILSYISIIILFFLVFKLRLRLEKQEQTITKLIRKIAMKD